MKLDEILRSVHRFTQDVIVITEAEPLTEPGPRIVFVNDAFERETGYSREEVLGKTPRMLQGPNTDTAASHRIGEALRSWSPVREEILNYRKDGSEFWSDLSIIPVADASGWYHYWVSVERDVTERVERERQLEAGYKALKAILDGSISTAPDNVLVYATSNRRHLLPEMMAENLDTRIVDGELHHGEAVEEKVSLSERFGLWLSFHPFSQDDYLSIVAYWLEQLGGGELDGTARKQALQWALTRGSRSGRVAFQFAKDWTGRRGL